MHIENSVLIAGHHPLADDGEETGEHHQINLRFRQTGEKRVVIGLLRREFPAHNHAAWHTGPLRAFQRVNARLAGQHKGNAAAVDLPGRLRIEKGLQIRAAARNEHCYVQHRITPSSLSTTEPIR